MNFDQLLADCIDFTQRLIQTPSMTYEEEIIANLIAAEMRSLNFDEVWLDDINNVYGRIHGRDRTLPALVLNTHTDHVDPGDPDLWPVPPYSGEIVDGRILGRGACDIKGPLAVQIYSMAGLLRAGERPRRDIVFTGVVEEEIGGTGSLHWAQNLDYPVDLVIVGEPSSNKISLGHRGIEGYWVRFDGRSVHASAPARGENPNYYLATFLQRLADNQHKLTEHPYLGKTTVAPTIIQVDTVSSNVTPAWVRVFLDFRTAAESPNSLLTFIRSLCEDLPHQILPGHPDWSNMDSDDILTGFDTNPETETVKRVQAALSAGMGREAELSSYQFATDGRLFPPFGLTVLGYAPGDETLAHTVKESIAIDEMAESLRGHMQLLKEY